VRICVWACSGPPVWLHLSRARRFKTRAIAAGQEGTGCCLTYNRQHGSLCSTGGETLAGGGSRGCGLIVPIPRRGFTAGSATLLYTAVTLAFTWPLAAGLARDVPWDLGDSLLNCWILAWHYRQAGTVLAGDWAAAAGWWHPGIFHPEPWTLGYSELLVTQALMGAPVYALTGNILLTYNVLFLGSFVLSALGVFLLVRDLTRDARAGWVAGLLYGFALYRVAQGSHLQVLSAQWAPFVLWFLHRWFDQGRWRDAALAGVALAAQNLSNGYYLFYLALLLPPYVVAQLAARRALTSWRAWRGPLAAGLIAAALTLPLLYPYVQLRRHGELSRAPATLTTYAADTQAWLTASDQVRAWGWLQTMPRPEGELFPGLLPLLLAAAGLALTLWNRSRGVQTDPWGSPRLERVRRGLVWGAGLLLAWHTLAIPLVLFGGITRVPLGPVVLRMTGGLRLLILWGASLTVLLLVSRRVRRACRDEPHAPVVALAALLAVTVWLSFGPDVRVAGRPSGWPGIYMLLHHGLPGADALRVPPRIAMMTTLLLAMLGGIGVAALTRERRRGVAAFVLVSVIILAEAWPVPIPINGTAQVSGFTPPPARVPAFPADDPDVRAIARLPADAVLLELPFGSLSHEIRWQYLSMGHWRPRVNGYSGGFPASYVAAGEVWRSLPNRQAEATGLLHTQGVTHVVLHPDVWAEPETGNAVRAWLAAAGARLVEAGPTVEIWRVRRTGER
jgi:hypothetical protein